VINPKTQNMPLEDQLPIDDKVVAARGNPASGG
jgi:hypothetical protein